MHKIYLYRSNGTWMAEHTDPMINELFGTAILPTAYTSEMDADRVAGLVAEKFPQYKVMPLVSPIWEK